MTQGIVDIHGKQYKTVAKRVNEFRMTWPASDGWAIMTELLADNAERVVVKAAIRNPNGITVGTGHAEEVRNSSNINKTSAMENCETGAIGRALAAIGLGGEEYASADEVLRAIEQQKDLSDNIPSSSDDKEQSVITDDNKQRVKNNINQLIDLIGEEEYKTWHDRVLSNFYGVDSIDRLSAGDLKDFADKQEMKIEESKE